MRGEWTAVRVFCTATLLIKLAAFQVLHGDGCEIDTLEAADIDTPQMGRQARPPEREDAAHRAKVVLRRFCMPLVQGHILQRRKQAKAVRFYPMHERTPAPAYRTVTGPHVIEVQIDLELNLPTVARTAVRLLHGL